MNILKQFIDIFRPAIIAVLGLFFDKKYLRGRHFEKGYSGIAYSIRAIWSRNFLRLSSPYHFPAAIGCVVSRPERIQFHPDDLNNFQSNGSYFQNLGADIIIGRGTYIAPNVGIITTNHSAEDLDQHMLGADVVIGENCWIGMNSVILPGVKLGKRTIVGAGAVVTKSFEEGNCVIAGVPAKIIKRLGP